MTGTQEDCQCWCPGKRLRIALPNSERFQEQKCLFPKNGKTEGMFEKSTRIRTYPKVNGRKFQKIRLFIGTFEWKRDLNNKLIWDLSQEASVGFSRCLILYIGQVKWPGNHPRNAENAPRWHLGCQPYRFFLTKNAQERPIQPSFGVSHRLFSVLTKR